MRFAVSPTLRIAGGFLLAASAGAIGYHVLHQKDRGTPEALLDRADEMSWLNNWIAAAPLCHKAELGCLREHELSRALYAPVIRNNRDTGERELVAMRWGLVLNFAKSLADFRGFSTINAKVESLLSNPYGEFRFIAGAASSPPMAFTNGSGWMRKPSHLMP